MKTCSTLDKYVFTDTFLKKPTVESFNRSAAVCAAADTAVITQLRVRACVSANVHGVKKRACGEERPSVLRADETRDNL